MCLWLCSFLYVMVLCRVFLNTPDNDLLRSERWWRAVALFLLFSLPRRFAAYFMRGLFLTNKFSSTVYIF